MLMANNHHLSSCLIRHPAFISYREFHYADEHHWLSGPSGSGERTPLLSFRGIMNHSECNFWDLGGK